MTLVGKTAINLAGLVVPVVFGFALFPVVIAHYGEERFGLLTIMWVLVSYSGIVDLGISRVTVREVGEAVGTNDERRIRHTVAMAHSLACLVGLVLGVLLLLLAGVAIARGWMPVAPGLGGEILNAVPYLAAALPFVSGAAVLRGEMEGRQWFGWSSLLRAVTGVAIFAVPLGSGIFGNGLRDIAIGFLLVRALVWLGSWWILARLRGSSVRLWPDDWSGLKLLAAQGGWMTITHVVTPLLAHIDRFVLLSFAGAAAVAHYATGNEVISKLWLVPTAATAVLFPEFARRISLGVDGTNLFGRAQRLIFALMSPVLVLLTIVSVPLLSAWLGPEFAAQTAPVLEILCLGMIVSCLSQIPATACLSAGAAKGVALIQCALLVLILPALVIAAGSWGATGVAWVWVCRILVDHMLLLWLVRRLKRGIVHSAAIHATLALSATGAALVAIAANAPQTIAVVLLIALSAWCFHAFLVELPRVRKA
jgi:O-antigen/teichoic acid export membrane protein